MLRLLGRARIRWIQRAITFMRWSRVLAYGSIALAGVSSLIYPPPAIANASAGTQAIELVWAAVMVVSAGFCAWGAAREHWIGEFIGLLPLGLVAAGFGVTSLARGTVGWSGGMFLLGFFWILMSRWQEVALLRAEAERQAKVRNGNGHAREGADPTVKGGA